MAVLMSPCAFRLPLTTASQAEFNILELHRDVSVSCPQCGTEYLLLLPLDSPQADEVYSAAFLKMLPPCGHHPPTVLWRE